MIEKFNIMIDEMIGNRNIYNDYSLTQLKIDTSELTIEAVKKFRRNLDFLKKINAKIEARLNG